MEAFLVILLLALLLSVSTGSMLYFAVALFLVAIVIGLRAYRIRCGSCGKRVIAGADMEFCNQCGARRQGSLWRLRCRTCRGMARTELNLKFCNRCGTTVTERY